MTEEAPDSQAFLAQKILELTAALSALPSIKSSLDTLVGKVGDIEKNVGMLKGWADGQEEISDKHGTKLNDILKEVQEIARVGAGERERLDQVIELSEKNARKLGGLEQLAKSTFEIAVELKSTGGANGEETKQAQAAP